MPDGEKDPPVAYADRLSEGFVPSQMPPLGPDGGLVLEPAPTGSLPVLADSLCQLGPCRHYHELVTSIDAQEPLGEETGVPRYRTTVRTCYPSPGIEADLGEQVIYDCNRWDPEDDEATSAREQRRVRARERREIDLALDASDLSPPET